MSQNAVVEKDFPNVLYVFWGKAAKRFWQPNCNIVFNQRRRGRPFQQFSFWRLRLGINPQAMIENVLKHVENTLMNLLKQVFYLNHRFQPEGKRYNSF